MPAMSDEALKEYRLSKIPKMVSFSHFDKYYTCPKRYCAETLDPEDDTDTYEAECIKDFPPMGLKVGDIVEFTIENDKYIMDGVGEIDDETFEEHFEDLTEELLPPDAYWAAIGTAIQAFVEYYAKRYLEILDADDFEGLVDNDLPMIAKCIVSNEDVDIHGKKIYFKNYKVVPDFRNFPVELGTSRVETIRKKFMKQVRPLSINAIKRMSKLDLSKVKTEMKFSYCDGTLTYVGSADMVYFHDTSLASIFDGKFRYNPAKHSKDQLYFYAWLMSKLGVDIKSLMFWDYSEDKLTPIKYNQYDVNRIGKKASGFIEDLTDSIEEDDFPECVNSYCRYCLRRDVCETYQEHN